MSVQNYIRKLHKHNDISEAPESGLNLTFRDDSLNLPLKSKRAKVPKNLAAILARKGWWEEIIKMAIDVCETRYNSDRIRARLLKNENWDENYEHSGLKDEFIFHSKLPKSFGEDGGQGFYTFAKNDVKKILMECKKQIIQLYGKL